MAEAVPGGDTGQDFVGNMEWILINISLCTVTMYAFCTNGTPYLRGRIIHGNDSTLNCSSFHAYTTSKGLSGNRLLNALAIQGELYSS